MALKLTNNAKSTLAASLGENDKVVRILAGHGSRFPTLNEAGAWFPLAVTDETGVIEYMRATMRLGDTIFVDRSQEGTKAQDWVSGCPVFLPLTTAALDDLRGLAGPLSLSIDDTSANA